MNLSVDFLHLFDNRLPIHAFFQDPDYRNSGIFIYVFHQNAACLRTLWREVLRFLPKHPYPIVNDIRNFVFGLAGASVYGSCKSRKQKFVMSFTIHYDTTMNRSGCLVKYAHKIGDFGAFTESAV